jgi:WD40 repeat protein
MSKKFNWKKISIGVLLLIALIIYLQFFYKTKHLDSGLYKLERVLIGHTSDVWAVNFSPNDQLIATAGVDSSIYIWDSNTGKIIHNLKHPAGVTNCKFSPDGNFIVSASYDSKIRIWQLPEGILLKEFSDQTGTVWCVEFSPDGNTIASGGQDTIIKLWDINTGQIKTTLTGHQRNIWDLKFNPDGKTLASGSFDKSIKIWNLATGKLIHSIDAHSQAVVSLAYSHDGKKLISTSDDGTIKLWDTDNWNMIYSLNVPEHPQASDFSSDDNLLITGGRDKIMIGEFLQNFFGDSEYNPGVSMRLWNAKTGSLLQTFSFHSNDVNDLSFSSDGKWIASASSDKTVGIWLLQNK